MEKIVRIFTKSGLTVKKFLVVFACLFAFSSLHAQEFKVGFVNSERIMRDSAPAKAASAKLESEFARREKELRDLQTRIKTMSDRLEKDMPVLSESDSIRRQRELVDLGQDFQNKNRRYREDLMQRRNEEMAAVLERINRVINNIAQQEKFDLILQEAVYFSPRLDITDKVLRALGN